MTWWQRIGGARVAVLLAALLVTCTIALVSALGADPPSMAGSDALPEPPARTPLEPSAGGLRSSGSDEPRFRRLENVTTAERLMSFDDQGTAAWRDQVDGIERGRIASTRDDERQPAFWLPPPAGKRDRPLLVVLHSWSATYRQEAGVPFARWADQQGWAMIHPDFRGPFDDPQATGSELAVRDVLDAVDFAVAQGGVDRDRVFVVGFSGGGLMSLLLAGRHPDRFAGAASWVPVHDLARWHAYNRDEQPGSEYTKAIETSCGGDPNRDESAREECRQRSPRTHLQAARRADVPVYIGTGLDDPLVPPDGALRAFNQLADRDDRIGRAALRAAARGRLPDRLRGSVEGPTFFDRGDPDVLFARRSGPVSVTIFDGEHDLVYHPALEWMSRIAEGRPPS